MHKISQELIDEARGAVAQAITVHEEETCPRDHVPTAPEIVEHLADLFGDRLPDEDGIIERLYVLALPVETEAVFKQVNRRMIRYLATRDNALCKSLTPLTRRSTHTPSR